MWPDQRFSTTTYFYGRHGEKEPHEGKMRKSIFRFRLFFLDRTDF